LDDKQRLTGEMSGSHNQFSISMPTIISPEQLKQVTKCCVQVAYIKCYPWHDRLPPNGRGQVT